MSAPEMTFWDHLEVLRWSLVRIVVVVLVLMIGSFAAMPFIFDDFVLGAHSSDFFVYKALGGLIDSEFNVEILNINVTGPFFVHMSTSFWMALVLGFPYLMWEIWHFIKPGLIGKEISGGRIGLLGGTLLFYLGAAVGYLLVFPITFRFLALYKLGSVVMTQISLNSYISTFLGIIFMMGILFELPIVIAILGKIGIVDRRFLRKYRPHAIVILLIVAAVVTPTGDPFTLMVVFLPIYILYELSILLVPARKAQVEE